MTTTPSTFRFLALLCVASIAVFSADSHAYENQESSQKTKTQQSKKKQAATPKKPRSNPAMEKVEDIDGLPRILLIGDSISIGYTVPVREALKGKANVHRPLTNCGPTTKGVAEIEKWLGDKKWDVIHFNFGLHDLKYMGPNGENLADPANPTSHHQVPPEEYRKNLETLVKRLEKTGAKLIWRNTTPVPKGAKGRVVGDSAKYNEIAAAIMKQHSIPTDDHYSLAMKKMKDIQLPANVHFTKPGSQQLADQVVASISQLLPTLDDQASD